MTARCQLLPGFNLREIVADQGLMSYGPNITQLIGGGHPLQHENSFDNLVRASEQCWRNFQAERFRCF